MSPFFIIMFISSCVRLLESATKYERVQKKYIGKNEIVREITNIGSRIHCSSACSNHADCKAFGYAKNKTCFLMNEVRNEDYCYKDGCLAADGMPMYRVTIKRSSGEGGEVFISFFCVIYLRISIYYTDLQCIIIYY